MDIREFFEQSCGKWFSQRTNQHLNYVQSEWGKSDVWIDLLPQDDPKVQQACAAHQMDPTTALFGVTVKWEGFVHKNPNKVTGTTMLVPMAGEAPNSGVLLRQTTQPQPVVAIAHYSLGPDDALTLTTDHEEMHIQERIWFVTPNLRLRASLLQRPNQVDTTTFCSEIRSVPPKKE
ncbi:MAG: phycobiliprotein lyase [Leptolyngbyaceae cyanobacterium]